MPMIMAGPEVPQGVACREPVSLVDCFPTIVDCVGLTPIPDDRNLPGSPLFDIVSGTAPRAHGHERVSCRRAPPPARS